MRPSTLRDWLDALVARRPSASAGAAIRRYVGTLRHRKLGVRENGMVVWRVAPGEIDRAGWKLASAPEISHCYAREAIDGFPYRGSTA